MAKVSQHDLAQLDDRQVRMLAVALKRAARDETDPAARFWHELSWAVAKAHRERRLLWQVAVHELEDDDEAGALVEEVSDVPEV